MEDKDNECRRLISYAVFLRNVNGISTKEVSERAGMKSQYVSRLESGTISPTLTSFINYVDGIGCEIEVVRKDGKNNYRRLVESLVSALDSKDKTAVEHAISDMKTTLYLDKIRESQEEERQKDIDLILEAKEKGEAAVAIERQRRSEAAAKRLKSYGKGKKDSKKRK